MTIFRWFALLIASASLTGCGALQALVLDKNNAPTATPPAQIAQTPPALYMMRGDIAFPMDGAGYCWPTTCVGVNPPIYTAAMHTLVIGNTLELRFETPFPDSVTASLHPGSNLMTLVPDLMAEAVMDENGRVLVTVPSDAEGDFVLVISALWGADNQPSGNARYVAPIRLGG